MYTTPQSTMPHPMEHKTVPPAKYRPATLGFTSHDWFAQLICSNLIFSCTSSSIRPHCPWHQSVTDAHNKPVCSEGTLSHVNSTSCNMSVQYLDNMNASVDTRQWANTPNQWCPLLITFHLILQFCTFLHKCCHQWKLSSVFYLQQWSLFA